MNDGGLLVDPEAQRALALDALAAILPADRRDRLATVLSDDDVATLRHLAKRGIGDNTLRALASDLAYLEARCRTAVGASLPWPAPESLVLKFIAHHLWDPTERAADPDHGMPEEVASRLRIEGVLRSVGPHAPQTVQRRLASWSTLHRWKGLDGPFGSPSLKTAMRLAVRASERSCRRKSPTVYRHGVCRPIGATTCCNSVRRWGQTLVPIHNREGHRWGRAKGKIGFHGGKVEVERPRVRARVGGELTLPSWTAAVDENLLGQWALNLMLMNVSTRKFGRAVRLPGGDIPAEPGAGVTKSAVSRRFVALSAEKMKAWMSADLSALDLLVIQIDGIHIDQDLILLAAVGVDGNGDKHPLGVMEGASENAAVCQALLDNMVGRGLDPAVCRLFIIDGSRALSKAIRNTFGRNAPIQRCQVHKARNITERLPKSLHASVRRALRQAWELDDADNAEKLLRNLARRLEREAPGVSASLLEGIDEILTVTRLRLPTELRRSLACTNIIENMNGTIRRVCRNVKRWRDAAMALRWTGAAMIEAAKGFRRLKAHKQLPSLRAALLAHQAHAAGAGLDPAREAA